MYLRTPKRYTRRGRSRRGFGCLRRLLFWIILIALIVISAGIYQNRDQFAPRVSEIVSNIVSDVGGEIGSINASPPTPTPDTTVDRERALAAWSRGSLQEAVNIYRRIIPFEPNNIVSHYQYAFGLIMEGRYEQALQAAEDTITADPFSPHGWTIRAMALNRMDRYGEAAASAIHALSLIPEDTPEDWRSTEARAMAFQAEAYLNLGLGDRALGIVERALEIDPESAEAYQVRGQINQLVNFDFAAARSDYAEAYTLNPNLIYLGIWLARINATTLVGKYQEALQIYQDLLERNPGNPQLLYDLGTYYYGVDNDFNRAREVFTRCIESNPDYAPCHYYLGRTEKLLEQPSLAIDPLLTALRLDPDDAYAMWWLAWVYRDLGQCPDAVPHLQLGRQLAVEQEDAKLVTDYDWLYEQCGLSPPQPETTPEVTEEAEAGADG